jgi:hypothetical protein
MKRLTTLAIIAVLFSSCVKKYNCKCTTTLNQLGYYPYETMTIQELPKHSSKKKATQICDNTGRQIQANVDELYPDDVTVSTKCVVKDN